MTEIFPSTRELQDVRGVSAVPPRGPLARRKHRRVNGTRGQRTEDDPNSTPYGSSMAATTPVLACWREVFPGSVHL
jgi:hypothetical protein